MNNDRPESERYAVSDEPGLIGKFRIPFTVQSVLTMAALITEHPHHSAVIEPPFLVLRDTC